MRRHYVLNTCTLFCSVCMWVSPVHSVGVAAVFSEYNETNRITISTSSDGLSSDVNVSGMPSWTVATSGGGGVYCSPGSPWTSSTGCSAENGVDISRTTARCYLEETGEQLPVTINGLTYDVVNSASLLSWPDDLISTTGFTPVMRYRVSGTMLSSVRYTDVVLVCVTDYSDIGVEGNFLGFIDYVTKTPATFRTWTARIPIRISDSTPRYTVSTPTTATGTLGDRLSHNFSVSITRGSVPVTVSWDVNAPCSGWRPELVKTTSPGDTPLGINHESEMTLTATYNSLTAQFTPDQIGGYSCTGTIRISTD
ncbi:hypothetical protein SB6422_05546 [Klebsiella huaxiensis]|uniref:Ig-like domain-containing protein n=1 Tax=Klebsiella huaxiensis TaxID=2153354 RepID=A0A564JJI0_9ENTR|nr:hypothetical protein SB6422_05546 [Klebsiella huaxiensis]